MALVPVYSNGADPRLQQQLAIQNIGSAIGSFGTALQKQREKQALIEALAGEPGAIGAGTGFAGSPELGGQTNTGTPGLLPGLDRRLIEAAVLGGGGDALLRAGIDRALPEPITPFQEAQLGLEREGMGLRREGMELDKQGLQLKREMFGSDQEFQRAKLALEERKLAQDAAGAGAAKLSDIGSFRGQFTGLSEDFIQVRDAYGKVRTAAENPSPAGDLSLIFGFMKMVDPGSVVREGEFATAQNTTNVPGWLMGQYNRLLTGERLTETQRSDFANQAHGLFGSQLGQQEELQNTYRGIAQRTMPNVDAADVVPDFIGKAREWSPVAAGPSAASQAGAPGAVQQGLDALRAVTEPFTSAPEGGGSTEDYGEGEIVTNPQTGERLILRGGQWVPYNG